jgi:phospholipid transport system substrate-binding protein
MSLIRLSRRALLASVAVLSCAPARFAHAASDPRGFVEELGAETLAILKGSANTPERQRRFRELFGKAFDVPQVGRFVLGRYWQRASEEERARYLEKFGDYVAAIYAMQFANYQGQSFRTTGARATGDGESTVTSEIVRQGQPPIAIEFRVKQAPNDQSGGGFKIVDAVVEGVSLIVTKREEFAGVLGREGMAGILQRMDSALAQMQRASR